MRGCFSYGVVCPHLFQDKSTLQAEEPDKVCSVGIASGSFEASARFKLRCCGIALETFPYATSSDTPRRRDIISLAAFRAGFDLTSVVYFADGPWDHRASVALGIPMIGIGRSYESLLEIGVQHTFQDYMEPMRIIEVLSELVKNVPKEALHPITQTAHSR